jgi:dienelactone hydrolase
MKTRSVTTTLAALTMSLLAAACGGSTKAPTAQPPAPTPQLAPSLLPEPTGSAAVGVRELASFGPDATARLWYPAVAGTGSGAPAYIAPERASALGLTLEDVERVHLRARLDAPPAATTSPRPGVVLMPGWGAPMALYTALAQELASHGYVVVTVDPALGMEDPNALPPDPADPAQRFDQLSSALDLLTSPTLATMAGLVDTERIAVGGHSIAGAVAVQASLVDPRIAAVFDLDGWLHGPALEVPVDVPALFVAASGFDGPTSAAIGRSTTAMTVELAGATHFDVSDVPCLAPALGPKAVPLGLGTIGCTGAMTANALVTRFLDAVLRDGRPTPDAAALAVGLAGIR